MIKCKKQRSNPTVKLGTLASGDTFLYQSEPCLVINRNGHLFAIFLKSGALIEKLSDETNVVPIECELTYYLK